MWGPGDTTLMPGADRDGPQRPLPLDRRRPPADVDDARRQHASRASVLAADRGTPGAAYFVTDGAPVVFREFVTALLAAHGVEPPDGSVPLPGRLPPRRAAGEAAWRALPLPGAPPLTRFAVWVASLECTLDDSRARADLGYAPVMTREEGLAALRRS